MGFLDYVIFENSIRNWLIALGILVGVLLILALIKRIITNRLLNRVKKSKTEIDNFIIPVLNQTRWFSFLALGLYLGIQVLNLPAEVRQWVVLGNQVILALQLGFWGTGLISYYVTRSVANKVKEDHGEDATTISASIKKESLSCLTSTPVIFPPFFFNPTASVLRRSFAPAFPA